MGCQILGIISTRVRVYAQSSLIYLVSFCVGCPVILAQKKCLYCNATQCNAMQCNNTTQISTCMEHVLCNSIQNVEIKYPHNTFNIILLNYFTFSVNTVYYYFSTQAW